MIRVVLDTNVLVAAFRSNRGASFRVVSLLGFSAPHIPIVSVPLVLEYEMALKQLEDVSSEDVESVLDYLCEVGDRREIYFLWRPVLNDPKDEMVLEVAVGGQAEAIVTHNARDFEGVEERFGIRIVSPATFLLQLEGQSK
jgi:putative PIN family toxin of toxin-antitoxin system